MKKFMLIAVATLSACSQKAEQPADTAAMETPEPAQPVAMAQSLVGAYDLKRYNGGTSTIVFNADGTYTDTLPDGTTMGSGKFALKDGKYCFDPESDQADNAVVCWTVGQPDADGRITATDPTSHHTVTLKRRAEPAAAATAEATKM
jgi:hypothetical protein